MCIGHIGDEKRMPFVVSNGRGYLYVDNSDDEHWVRSPFNANRFDSKDNAERNARIHNAVVVEIP